MKLFDRFRFHLNKTRTATVQRSPVNSDPVAPTSQRSQTSSETDTLVRQIPDIAGTIERALAAAGLIRRGDELSANAVNVPALPTLPTLPTVRPAVRAPSYAGEFLTRSFTNRAGTRSYKLYIPSTYTAVSAGQISLIVMLHGCTQSADDFAAGTRMNALAEQHGFLVAYPEQNNTANGSKCWNWFRSADQHRDSGEPSIIAGITRQIASEYAVNEHGIFVAGLSAGAAMAIILGATYPELYAGVGAHSGLAYGSAQDVPSAFAVMKKGVVISRMPLADPPSNMATFVPTIIFQGDHDQTVTARNADAIIEQAIACRLDGSLLSTNARIVHAPGSRNYTHTVYAADNSPAQVEYWLIHGAGHAWSGGSPSGSYTDAHGPDASAEMVRFFQEQAVGKQKTYQ